MPDGTERYDGPNAPDPNKPDTIEQRNRGDVYDSPLGQALEGVTDFLSGLIGAFKGGGFNSFLGYDPEETTQIVDYNYRHPEPWEIAQTGEVRELPTMNASQYMSSREALMSVGNLAVGINVKSVDVTAGKRTFHIESGGVEGTLEKFGTPHASWLNNNPGNLTTDSKYAHTFSAVKKADGTLQTDENGYVIFPSIQNGILAQMMMLRDRPGNPTLQDTILQHLPITDLKDKNVYVRRIQEITGLDPSTTKIDDMTGAQLGTFGRAVADLEGFNYGRIEIPKGNFSPQTQAYIFRNQGVSPEELPLASPLQQQFNGGGVPEGDSSRPPTLTVLPPAPTSTPIQTTRPPQ